MPIVLHIDPTQWTLRYSDTTQTVNNNAQSIRDALNSLNVKNSQPLAITLASSLCYASVIDLTTLPKKPSYQQLLYAMEEKLPLAAEEFVGSVSDLSSANINSTLAIATKHLILKTLIDDLESLNIPIEFICPQAILALDYLANQNSELNDAYIIYQDKNHLDLFKRSTSNKMQTLELWHHLLDSPNLLYQQLSILTQQAPAKIIAINCNDNLLQNIQSQTTNLQLSTLPDAAYDQITHLLKNKTAPQFDLRQGELSPTQPLRRIKKQLITLSLTAALAISVTLGGILYRSNQYHQIATKHKQTINDLHLQITGHHSQTPISDLRIKAQTLTALHPTQAQTHQSQESDKPSSRLKRSSLKMLTKTLKRLPKHLRINLTNINAYPDQVTLNGYTRSLVDAANIATALGHDKTLKVKKPDSTTIPSKIDRTKRKASFTIIAQPNPTEKGGKS